MTEQQEMFPCRFPDCADGPWDNTHARHAHERRAHGAKGRNAGEIATLKRQLAIAEAQRDAYLDALRFIGCERNEQATQPPR